MIVAYYYTGIFEYSLVKFGGFFYVAPRHFVPRDDTRLS